MAYFRIIVLQIVILAGLIPIPAFAYDRATHEGITQAIVQGYEKLHGDTLGSSGGQRIIAGSSAEDNDWRFLNHFYDPINYRGLTVFGISLGQPSEGWANDTRGQATWRCIAYFPCSHDIGYNDKLFSSPTDYSWDRAIYEYVYGDKQRGLEAVGHVLHYIEDATVPAHVRNDQHGHLGAVGDPDPYEEFANQFTSANIVVPSNLSNIPTYSNLSSYLDHVARFTNTHFVSKDSLFKTYDTPALKSLEVRDGFATDPSDGHKVAKVQRVTDPVSNRIISEEVLIDDIEHSVAKDNWSILSKEAIVNGIGIIDLFFKSVEQEKKTGALKAKNISAAEQNAIDLAKKGFKYVKGTYGSSLSQSEMEELLGDNAGQAGAAALAVAGNPPQQDAVSKEPAVPTVSQTNPPQKQSATPATSPPLPLLPPLPPSEDAPKKDPTPAVPPAPTSSPATLNSAPASGGGPTATASTATQSTDASSSQSGGSTPSATTTTTSLSLSILSPDEGATFATTSVTFTGTTSAASTVTAAYDSTLATTTTDGSGSWSFNLTLSSGTTAISFSAATSTEVTATSTRTVVVDTTPPAAPSISIEECAASFTTGDCTAATTTVTVAWNTISDAAYYGLFKDNTLFATTSAISATSSIGTSTATTFLVVAYKANGTAATSTSKTALAIIQPLLINEIAWAGTNASTEDEWIELRNMTNSTLDLSRFVITSLDGSRTIQLSGTISAAGDSSAHDFFLIERNADATSAVSPNALAMDFAQLSDSGEQLLLQWGNGIATTTVDSTPLVATCSGWCGGASLGSIGYSVQSGTSTGQLSMERKDSSPDGSLTASWQTADGYTLGAFDRSSGVIYGTPSANNSKGNPSAGWFCSPDTTSITSGTHYTPASSNCTYLMRAISTQANRYGALYRGDVGSSTLVHRDFAGHAYIRQLNSVVISNPQAGEHFFIAIYEARVGPNFDSYPTDDSTLFDNYFSAGTNAPPHSNYFVIPWIYGP